MQPCREHPALFPQPYLAFRRQSRVEVLLGGFLCASSSRSASLRTSPWGCPGRRISTISAAMAPGSAALLADERWLSCTQGARQGAGRVPRPQQEMP